MSTLWVHGRGIIQQSQVGLLDGFEPNAEPVVVLVSDVAVDVERLLYAELVLDRDLQIRAPVGDVLSEEYLERDADGVETERGTLERQAPFRVRLRVDVPQAVIELPAEELAEYAPHIGASKDTTSSRGDSASSA